MQALVLAQGARGALVRRLQQGLVESSYDTGGVDGRYGPRTTAAVRMAQKQRRLTETGGVDPVTWAAITGEAVPPLLGRALQLRAAFEGHGFGLPKGNFDGAGITWGIIGFTLRHGEARRIIQEAEQQDPAFVRGAFGNDADELLRVLALPLTDQLSWADQRNIGASRAGLAEPWATHFTAFGDLPAVQIIQLRHVTRNYFQPATATAARYGLKTELGLALCFDIHVQDGGVNPRAAAAIDAALDPAAPEPGRRLLVAKCVAAQARPDYRADVEARKTTIATDAGSVHRAAYTLANWGWTSLWRNEYSSARSAVRGATITRGPWRPRRHRDLNALPVGLGSVCSQRPPPLRRPRHGHGRMAARSPLLPVPRPLPPAVGGLAEDAPRSATPQQARDAQAALQRQGSESPQHLESRILVPANRVATCHRQAPRQPYLLHKGRVRAQPSVPPASDPSPLPTYAGRLAGKRSRVRPETAPAQHTSPPPTNHL